ncbi:MAG: potassium channel protein [Syntrophomonadaceae bacterium]
MNESKLKLLSTFLAMVGMIFITTAGLYYFENWSLFDSLWVAIVSLTTTGYGDMIPVTLGGRIFLLTVLVIGVGVIFYGLSIIISLTVEAQISMMMEKKKMQKAIAKLENHVVVCGAGRVGSAVAQILVAEKMPFVLIDNIEELVVSMRDQGYLVIHGDATQDDVLQRAGIGRARGIICALSEDAYNVFVVLTSRAANPGLKIVSRANKPETVPKLMHAGADKVIAPTQIGGRQMAMSMLKPATVDLVDTLFTTRNLEIQLEEVEIGPDSALANKAIRDSFDRNVTNVIVVGIIRGEQVSLNPHGHDVIKPGDTLVLIGSRQDLEKLESTTLT